MIRLRLRSATDVVKTAMSVVLRSLSEVEAQKQKTMKKLAVILCAFALFGNNSAQAMWHEDNSLAMYLDHDQVKDSIFYDSTDNGLVLVVKLSSQNRRIKSQPSVFGHEMRISELYDGFTLTEQLWGGMITSLFQYMEDTQRIRLIKMWKIYAGDGIDKGSGFSQLFLLSNEFEATWRQNCSQGSHPRGKN